MAIDPDIHKSGVAFILDGKTYLASMTIGEMIDLVRSYENPHIIIEAAWLEKKKVWNWQKNNNDLTNISSDAGMNRGYGKAIYDILLYYGCEVVTRKPMAKSIFKKKGKWDKQGRDLFHKTFPELPKVTNDDCRDAYLLLYQTGSIIF